MSICSTNYHCMNRNLNYQIRQYLEKSEELFLIKLLLKELVNFELILKSITLVDANGTGKSGVLKNICLLFKTFIINYFHCFVLCAEASWVILYWRSIYTTSNFVLICDKSRPTVCDMWFTFSVFNFYINTLSIKSLKPTFIQNYRLVVHLYLWRENISKSGETFINQSTIMTNYSQSQYNLL